MAVKCTVYLCLQSHSMGSREKFEKMKGEAGNEAYQPIFSLKKTSAPLYALS